MKRALLITAVAFLAGTAVSAHAQEAARVIVKYRDGSTQVQQNDASGRVRALSARTGMAISAERRMFGRMHVVEAKDMTSQQLAAKMSAQADVEYAVPDRRKSIRALPNDPLFGQQWYLQSGEKSAINAQGAWDITTGSNIVVAVVDTGIRPDHPDLAGKLVRRSDGSVVGYDFVSDPTIANDGDGRDADPSDPGDFITQSDINGNRNLFFGCTVEDSSWHGTKVAGIIGAATNNSTGVAGVSWGARILPVRALGKCGGYDSDILAAMYWSAGLPVDGAPNNPTPAKVINLSIGGSGTCSPAYRDAINQITALGTNIVVAAGNANGTIGEPGNCPGVLTVAGVRHTGGKVGYSSYGPQAGIAAPAGNCVNTVGSCQYPIITTDNDGTQGPRNNIYSDQNTHIALGTSFATPMVTGVAALMLSVNPSLTPATVMSRIKGTATAFPSEAGLPSCNTGTNSDAQCNCTTTTCGAGILNARNAVADAQRPQASIAAVTNAVAGSAITLDGSGSTAANDRRIVSYAWSLVSGSGIVTSLSGIDQAQASALPATNGTFVVKLTVTDDQGATDTANVTVTVGSGSSSSSSSATSSTPASGGDSGGGGGGAIDLLALCGLLLLALISYAARRLR